MLLSLIVPAYNEEDYLAGNLASLKAQTYEPKEIIVVDNNSSDRTAEIARSMGVRVISEPKRGYHAAVRAGMEAASGEFVSVCDADTRFPPRWAENAVKALRKGAVGVYGPVGVWDVSRSYSFGIRCFYTAWCGLSGSLRIPFTVGPNFVYSRKAFWEVGGLETIPASDISLGRKLSRRGRVVFLPNNPTYSSYRRIRKEGLAPNVRHFFVSQWEVARGKPASLSYEQYNKVHR